MLVFSLNKNESNGMYMDQLGINGLVYLMAMVLTQSSAVDRSELVNCFPPTCMNCT